jgi:uncharacterized cupin superfamily protein
MPLPVAAIVDFATAPSSDSTWRPDAEKIVAGDPVQTARNFFSDPTGQFHAGIWDGAPGIVRITYTESEFCHILAGRVILTDEAGDARSFAAGDAFVIPAGFTGLWETVEPVRKFYVIFEAKGEDDT